MLLGGVCRCATLHRAATALPPQGPVAAPRRRAPCGPTAAPSSTHGSTGPPSREPPTSPQWPTMAPRSSVPLRRPTRAAPCVGLAATVVPQQGPAAKSPPPRRAADRLRRPPPHSGRPGAVTQTNHVAARAGHGAPLLRVAPQGGRSCPMRRIAVEMLWSRCPICAPQRVEGGGCGRGNARMAPGEPPSASTRSSLTGYHGPSLKLPAVAVARRGWCDCDTRRMERAARSAPGHGAARLIRIGEDQNGGGAP